MRRRASITAIAISMLANTGLLLVPTVSAHADTTAFGDIPVAPIPGTHEVTGPYLAQLSVPGPALASLGPVAQPVVRRLGGTDRYDTGRVVSQRQWQAGAANAVVLARGDQSPDALSGVPLAAHVHGPLLLTDPQVLDEATRAEIDRVLGGPGSKKTVYILGGFSAVSSNIETGLRNAGYQVVRYAGSDRYQTSLAIAASFGPTTHVIAATGGEYEVAYGRAWHVVTAPGRDFPDALSAGPLGAVEDAPVVLTPFADTEVTAFLLTNHQVIEAVGGKAADFVARLPLNSGKTAVYLVGPDRYSTGAVVAARIAAVTGRTPTSVGIASGVAFPDALTGGAFAANAKAPLLLTDPAALPDSTRGLLASWAPQLAEITVFGGGAAISTRTFESIVDAARGRAG